MTFINREQAYGYAKRLKEFIRYTCKKNADMGWFAQAMIVTSNTQGQANYMKWSLGDINTSWHIHILLVSKPTYTFREAIKKYIDNNWFDIPRNRSNHFDYSKAKNKKVYKKNCNIGLAKYLFLQCEDILFCDYNYTLEESLKYSLKDLFKEFMKVSTFKTYNAKEYCRNIKIQECVDERYNTIINFFKSLTLDQDKRNSDSFMKCCFQIRKRSNQVY